MVVARVFAQEIVYFAGENYSIASVNYYSGGMLACSQRGRNLFVSAPANQIAQICSAVRAVAAVTGRCPRTLNDAIGSHRLGVRGRVTMIDTQCLYGSGWIDVSL